MGWYQSGLLSLNNDRRLLTKSMYLNCGLNVVLSGLEAE